jgi:hypothetical protein
MVRWYEHVAYIGHKGNPCRVLVGKGEGKRPLRRSGVAGRMILKWILKKWFGRVWIGFIWLRTRTSGRML